MFQNALQIAEQYKHLRKEFLKGSLSKFLHDYYIFDGSHMSSIEIHINQLLDAAKYDEVVNKYKRIPIYIYIQLCLLTFFFTVIRLL